MGQYKEHRVKERWDKLIEQSSRKIDIGEFGRF